MQLIRRALQRSEIVAQGPRNGLFEGLFERFLPLFQGFPLPFAIMETVSRGVNGHSSRMFLSMQGMPEQSGGRVQVSLAFPGAGSYLRGAKRESPAPC